ncbi:MAG: DNA-3-methyladenine glycosylase I, partial [Mycobacteriaceae bacterium]|nr:DNA-3-methyladenine glycosylase I [Mycobacteriaceae bacterium]
MYRDYHDQEWGRPLRGRTALFERLSLEAFQSGLSWLVILRKREAFRRAFAGFDIDTVARYTDADVARLMGDPAIVRNRAKIDATVSNARVAADLDVDLSD